MKIWRNYSAIATDGGSWTVARFFPVSICCIGVIRVPLLQRWVLSVSICCIGVIRVPLLQRVGSFREHLLHRGHPRSAVAAGEFFPWASVASASSAFRCCSGWVLSVSICCIGVIRVPLL